MKRRRSWLEEAFEFGIFNSRWLLAPFYVGLLIMLAILALTFVRELIADVGAAMESSEKAILLALNLIDLSLAGNLILIVTFSGYENFVSKIDTGASEDRPSWMGKVDFSGLKIRVIASIVAISAIALLKSFFELNDAHEPLTYDAQVKLGWLVGLHLVFIISGVLLAFMDWLMAKSEAAGGAPHE
jgi:uncharacterized protein (TIGR00645 family)